MDKKELKEQAESMGIEVDGRWSEKRIQEEIEKAGQPENQDLETAGKEPEASEVEEAEPIKEPEQARHIESGDLLRMMAEQRKKTGKLNAYAKSGKPRQRKVKGRSKIHGFAMDKV